MPTNTSTANRTRTANGTATTNASNGARPSLGQRLLTDEDRRILEATIRAVATDLPILTSRSHVAAVRKRLARTLVNHPRAIARQSIALSAEQLKIAVGASDIVPDGKDRRFADDWNRTHPVFRRLAQSQVALEQAAGRLIDDLEMDENARLRSELIAAIVTSAVSPSNHLLGNPAALKEAARTRGRSLVAGMRNALNDLKANGGMPAMADTRPFVPGKTVAATPGAVVFRTPQFELIQYTPTTKQVFQRPMMVVPPQINRYYVLDLAPGRSLVEHLVASGHQVFLVSWRNVTPEHRDWDFNTYLSALREASDAVLEISGSDDLNLLGVCAGGITSATLAAYYAANGDDRVKSASFLVTILEWGVPLTVGTMVTGPMQHIARLASRSRGMLDGKTLGKIFAWLRPNDLVWNYWVNNYLMGKTPAAFDVLAWNSDATNLPAALHADFLTMAAGNSLAEPGKVIALDTPIDLRKVTCDSFVVGAVTDHITPWKACYETVNLLGGCSEFVLSSQGHIQALVNPSGNPKGEYRTNREAIGVDMSADEWYSGAEVHRGSWWDHWTAWLKPRSGRRVPAPCRLGNDSYQPLVDAPGTYVVS